MKYYRLEPKFSLTRSQPKAPHWIQVPPQSLQYERHRLELMYDDECIVTEISEADYEGRRYVLDKQGLAL